jgi:hypothetical protein
MEVGASIVEIGAGMLGINWTSINSALGQQILRDTLGNAGLDPGRKARWFIKRAYSSGCKGVKHVDETSSTRLPGLIARAASGFINPSSEVFLLQPAISSTTTILGDKRRVKIGLYLCGADLQVCGIDMMTTPAASIEVHGGSRTDYWIVA